jgi:hypothetical protein
MSGVTAPVGAVTLTMQGKPPLSGGFFVSDLLISEPLLR